MGPRIGTTYLEYEHFAVEARANESALYQGGSEIAFEMQTINKEMVIVIQGLIILFSGALEHLFRPKIESLFTRRPGDQAAEA